MKKSKMQCCSPIPSARRPLLSIEQAGDLMGLFKILANDTRLRLLQALAKNRELCVGDLAEEIGAKPQAVSNQLQRLVDRRIIGSRREKNNIYYRIIDPCVPELLDRGLCLLEDAETRRKSE